MWSLGGQMWDYAKGVPTVNQPADVQALTGKPKSSTSRLLRSLRDCGLREQDAHTRRYRPGLLTFELGRLHRAHDDLIAIVERELRDVCARTGHTGYIAVLDGYQQVVLRIAPGSISAHTAGWPKIVIESMKGPPG